MHNVTVRDITIGQGHPLALIAGPCVLESRDMAFRIAEEVCQLTAELGIPYIFKGSFDKANRTALSAFRGPGLYQGLEILAAVRDAFNVPVCTDFHEPDQAAEVAKVVDLLQVPAFLCRQTDMLVAAAETGKPTSVKKGQFLAPWDMRNVVDKFTGGGNQQLLLTERGASFGYNNLIVDMRSLAVMRDFGYPVIFDGTHSAQLPGGTGTATGGQREFIPALVRGAVAIGVDALFLEVHPDPERGLSDATTMWPLARLRELLTMAQRIDAVGGRQLTPAL
ncbi:MAG TPA: 3-deoxy-8-phosphooctulonate synthase [Armatimonadota bacterium]|jgi:2-dehydro-3-deoxyphosphooctonate aldolase (KDO 8-P synthase)